jgi:hypothetical protein
VTTKKRTSETHAYHFSARESAVVLTAAMREAKALLPRAVTTHHWIAGHHSPAAWEATEHWYLGTSDADPDVSRILCDLKLMANALACVQSVTQERVPVEAPVNLKLAKARRTA